MLRIPDPNVSTPDLESRVKKIPDPGSALKNVRILALKTVSKLSEKIIWDVHPGFRIRIFFPSRIQGPKRHLIPDPDPQHCVTHPFMLITSLGGLNPAVNLS